MRSAATQPAPDLTVPEPFGEYLLSLTQLSRVLNVCSLADSVDSILARFADAGGFTAQEVVALLVS